MTRSTTPGTHARSSTASSRAEPPPARTTYRHGDLRQALLEAGIELARAGGPDAVVLREATRRAGVVPNAAYRHFANREDLLQAVRSAALSSLARAMEAGMDTAVPTARGKRAAAEAARASLRAVGAGYLRFALAEPGLFRTAFSVPGDPRVAADPAKAGDSGLNPFQLLGAALDRMAHAGVLPADKRLGAEYLAWSAVHGLALLVIDGPLREVSATQIRVLGQRLLDMVEQGLA
ncbi:TetR/AcrR family transcriptional regulator [Aquabacterium soli]|uniref:TetR/AcrR family transcriptional regulator n=1 Tax=Aquabacterium soli TaxID=2493092 RepID=A0A3R8S1Y5_9BURK|nr:TetR/AcrR family transcriptional regulator [Aquabacterium soli]RRS04283.1 TetR/AcrR family transcriptional regulator [Aquabacterium soli]